MSRTEMSQAAEPRWSRFSPEGPLLRPRRAPYLPSSSRRTQLRLQVLQSHQVEAGAGEGEDRAHLLLSPMPELAQTPGHLHPTEGLFHDLAPALTHGVALPAGGALVDGVVLFLLGHMGGDTKAPGFLDEILGVVALVRPYGQPTFAPTAFSGEERKSRLFFGRAGGLGEGAVDDEAVPVLHHDMSGVGKPGFLAPALAGETGLGIGPGGVGRVRTGLPAEVDLGVSAWAPGGGVTAVLVISLVFGSEALQGGGRLLEGAVHAEVLPGEELLRLCLSRDLLKEDIGHVGGQDTVPVLGEARGVPGSLRELQAHEPAEEQVVFQVFAELALRGDAVQGLQDQGTQETLRRDGDPPFPSLSRHRGSRTEGSSPAGPHPRGGGWSAGGDREARGPPGSRTR